MRCGCGSDADTRHIIIILKLNHNNGSNAVGLVRRINTVVGVETVAGRGGVQRTQVEWDGVGRGGMGSCG